MFDLFTTILPVFILIGIGALSKILKISDDNWITVMNNYAFNLGFPAIIFSSLIKLNKSTINYDIMIYNSLILVVLMTLIFFLTKIFKMDEETRNCYIICSLFGNVAYVGIPFINSILQNEAGNLSIIVASYTLVMFTLGLAILEFSKYKKIKPVELIKNIIKNPFIISIFFATIVLQLNIALPMIIIKSIDMLASGASSVVLLALGIFLVKPIKLNKNTVHATILSVLKLIILPIVFILIRNIFFKDLDFSSTIIEAGMPGAVTLFVLSQKYKMNKNIVVEMIIISTVLSIITLPILTSFLL